MENMRKTICPNCKSGEVVRRGFKRLDRADLLIEFFAVNYNYLMPHEKKEIKVEWEQIPVMINS